MREKERKSKRRTLSKASSCDIKIAFQQRFWDFATTTFLPTLRFGTRVTWPITQLAAKFTWVKLWIKALKRRAFEHLRRAWQFVNCSWIARSKNADRGTVTVDALSKNVMRSNMLNQTRYDSVKVNCQTRAIKFWLWSTARSHRRWGWSWGSTSKDQAPWGISWTCPFDVLAYWCRRKSAW